MTTTTAATAPFDPAALVAAVRARATPLGYRVTRTADGFTVERDLADARFWGPLHKAGVHTVTGHEVRLDPARGVLAVTDVQRDLEWRAGNDGLGRLQPFWSLRGEVSRGRVLASGTTRSYGVREDGTVGVIEDYTFATADGRGAVREAAAELGWRERMPLDQRIGLVVGLGTLVLLVLCFGTWGLVALLG